MSQPQLGMHVAEVRFNEDNEPSKKNLLDLFFDLDFIENEDMYRKDTISLGFKSEAERVVSELLEQDLEPEELLESCISAQTDSSGFYKDTNVIIHEAFTERGDKLFIVSVGYMTEC